MDDAGLYEILRALVVVSFPSTCSVDGATITSRLSIRSAASRDRASPADLREDSDILSHRDNRPRYHYLIELFQMIRLNLMDGLGAEIEACGNGKERLAGCRPGR